LAAAVLGAPCFFYPPSASFLLILLNSPRLDLAFPPPFLPARAPFFFQKKGVFFFFSFLTFFAFSEGRLVGSASTSFFFNFLSEAHF